VYAENRLLIQGARFLSPVSADAFKNIYLMVPDEADPLLAADDLHLGVLAQVVLQLSLQHQHAILG
jgi:hypothetical protein